MYEEMINIATGVIEDLDAREFGPAGAWGGIDHRGLYDIQDRLNIVLVWLKEVFGPYPLGGRRKAERDMEGGNAQVAIENENIGTMVRTGDGDEDVVEDGEA